MKKIPKLCDLFTAIGAKYLKPIDADPRRSNQHEVGGLSALGKSWENKDEGISIDTTFLYFGNEEIPICENGKMTWYNARRNNPNRSPEWRLYYEENDVTKLMKPDDFLIVAQKKNKNAYFIVAPMGSDEENALKKLFAIKEVIARGEIIIDKSIYDMELDAASRQILDMLGIEYEYYDENILDELLSRFNGTFPNTEEFSKFAREHSGISARDMDADSLLVEWYHHEELLFRTNEKHIFENRIKQGFKDLDEFIGFSLSLQNRRKSRAGKALENHAEAVFKELGIKYARGTVTENRSSPDFLFPSKSAYDNNNFPDEKLAMLGVKTTCKDRWRQVLAEARRIKIKHLLTLQPAISINQTDEMKSNNLQLVVPASLHYTYSEEQKRYIWKFGDFCEWILDLQKTHSGT